MELHKINELKAQLARCPGDPGCAHCLMASTCYIEQQALEYIIELEKTNQNFVDVIHSLAECTPEWISVKDRLPEDDQDVLVCVNGNTIDTGYCAIHCSGLDLQDDMNRHWCTYACVSNNVTHWQPLPELPKEGEG